MGVEGVGRRPGIVEDEVGFGGDDFGPCDEEVGGFVYGQGEERETSTSNPSWNEGGRRSRVSTDDMAMWKNWE